MKSAWAISMLLALFSIMGGLPGTTARAEVITYVCNDSGTVRIDTKTKTVTMGPKGEEWQGRLLTFNNDRIYFTNPKRSNVTINRKTGWNTCDDCDGGDQCRQVK